MFVRTPQIETLCKLLGATVVQTEDALASSDTLLTRLVLIPAWLPTDYFNSFAKQRFARAALVDNMRSVANTPRSQKLWALRSTWLTDSLAAQFHAPLEEYSYGILIFPEGPFRQGLFEDRRPSRTDLFVDRRPARQESTTEV